MCASTESETNIPKRTVKCSVLMVWNCIILYGIISYRMLSYHILLRSFISFEAMNGANQVSICLLCSK